MSASIEFVLKFTVDSDKDLSKTLVHISLHKLEYFTRIAVAGQEDRCLNYGFVWVKNTELYDILPKCGLAFDDFNVYFRKS